MKKKKLLLLLALIAFGFNCIAQFSVGPRIGMNYSTLAYNYKNADAVPDTRLRVGPMIGILFHQQINDIVGIRAGINFSGKGTSYNIEEYYSNDNYVYEGWRRISYNYFEIPVEVTVGGKLGNNYLFGSVGPYFGLFITGRDRYDIDKFQLNPDGTRTFVANLNETKRIVPKNKVTSGDLEQDKYYLRLFDVGINFGIGYRIKFFVINFQYGLGLMNLTPDYTTYPDRREDYKKYNRVMSVNIAFLFGGNK